MYYQGNDIGRWLTTLCLSAFYLENYRVNAIDPGVAPWHYIGCIERELRTRLMLYK
jgi:hypothetical protein